MHAYLYKVGACIVSPMKKIVAVGHHHKLRKAADKTVRASRSTDYNDLKRSMKGEGLDFGKYNYTSNTYF
jgi:deoxycytidylate deaminase